MSHRSLSACRSWILAAAFVAATGGAASVGRTQQVTGSIGVSLTILEPIPPPRLRLTTFDLGRDGLARVETTGALSAPTSPLVTVRVSRSAPDFTPEQQCSMRVAPSSVVTRTPYPVNVGRDRRAPRPVATELRVEYVIVAAGT